MKRPNIDWSDVYARRAEPKTGLSKKRSSKKRRLETSFDSPPSKPKLRSIVMEKSHYICKSCSNRAQSWSESQAAELGYCPDCLDKLIESGDVKPSYS